MKKLVLMVIAEMAPAKLLAGFIAERGFWAAVGAVQALFA